MRQIVLGVVFEIITRGQTNTKIVLQPVCNLLFQFRVSQLLAIVKLSHICVIELSNNSEVDVEWNAFGFDFERDRLKKYLQFSQCSSKLGAMALNQKQHFDSRRKQLVYLVCFIYCLIIFFTKHKCRNIR